MIKAALTVVSIAFMSCAAAQSTLREQNELLFRELQQVHGLSDQEMRDIRAIFAHSAVLGQGNPAITQHPVTPQQCDAKLKEAGADYRNAKFERICGAKYMAPLYDAKKGSPEKARACIDQFEFPDIPCTYPVVWVKAREAAQICEAEGKRLCDAHEWEGACAGSLEPPDYRFDLAQGQPPDAAIRRMRLAHNAAHQSDKTWSYGPEYQRGICADRQLQDAGVPRGRVEAMRLEHLSHGGFPRLPQPAGCI